MPHRLPCTSTVAPLPPCVQPFSKANPGQCQQAKRSSSRNVLTSVTSLVRGKPHRGNHGTSVETSSPAQRMIQHFHRASSRIASRRDLVRNSNTVLHGLPADWRHSGVASKVQGKLTTVTAPRRVRNLAGAHTGIPSVSVRSGSPRGGQSPMGVHGVDVTGHAITPSASRARPTRFSPGVIAGA